MAKIQSVWENAPGRHDENGKLLDKWIGVQIQGVRKTKSGYVYNSWWFFLRDFPDKEASYWYRKRRLPAKEGEEEGEIIEEYVGKELPFEVPPELAESKWGLATKSKKQD
jgi:transposase